MAYTNTRERRWVAGNKKFVSSNGTVNIIGDTWATNLNVIESVQVNSGGLNAIGATVSGGTVTFTGATGAVHALAIGY